MVTLENYVKQGEQAKTSSRSRKRSKSPSCMLELLASNVDGDVRHTTRVADIIPYGQSEHRTDPF
jgi:hypothetical protein